MVMVHLLGAALLLAVADVLGHEHKVWRGHVVELPQRVNDARVNRGCHRAKQRRRLPQ
jgi:hypothetical protein